MLMFVPFLVMQIAYSNVYRMGNTTDQDLCYAVFHLDAQHRELPIQVYSPAGA